MVINNRLDKTFGPQMSFSGWILLVFGLAFILNIMGIILIIIGFVLATFKDGVMLDTIKSRVRQYSGPFGFALYGRWQALDNFSGLTVVQLKRKITQLSRSNRENSYFEEDFRVFLVGKDHKPAFPIFKSPTKELAVKEMDKLAELLNWTVWSPHEK
jgi:hypothetical protein